MDEDAMSAEAGCGRQEEEGSEQQIATTTGDVMQQCWDLLLDQILPFLPMKELWRCQAVDRLWRQTVGSTVWLWKVISMPRELRPRLTPAAFTFMAKSAQGTVEEIDLRGTANVDCSTFMLPGAAMVQDVQVLRLNREEHARTLPMSLEMCKGFPHLRVLDLRLCPAVDDALVANLCRAQCAVTLQDLNLRGCLISDESVMCVARCCVSLRVLDIGAWPHSRFRGVRSVTDVSLFFIAQCAALRGVSFALENVSIVGRRGTSDEGVEALIEFVPRLKRLDVRHCPAVTQTPTPQCVSGGSHDPRRIWRHGRFDNCIEMISDTSCDGAVTPPEYRDEHGVTGGWNDVQTATGLWQLLQSIAAVRAAAELQARATAEAQAEDMLVEAAEVQARASEIHAQAIDMQAQAAEILTRVAEVQLQVTAMQAQAEEQGHVAARAQAAEMQAQVAQMQVHAAQMQVHAAQMQIRATEMQGQAAEMQSSALSIRAQAATVSFAELTNTATNALTQAAAASNAGAAGAATADTGAASVRVEEIRGEAELGAERVSQGGDDGASSAAASVENARGSGGSAEQESTYTDGRHVVEHAPAASGSSLPETAAGVAASGSAISATARFEAVRTETVRLTRAVRGLTAQVERVTLREQAHAALLTHEVQSVTRRAEAFIAEHRALVSRTQMAGTQTPEDREEEERDGSQGESAFESADAATSPRELAGAEATEESVVEDDSARPDWRTQQEQVAARLAEIERLRERLRMIGAMDSELEAQRRQRENHGEERRDVNIDRGHEDDREVEVVQEEQGQESLSQERELLSEREGEREEQNENETQTGSGHAHLSESAEEIETEDVPERNVNGASAGDRRSVTDMQAELEGMRAEHARLLRRRNAEIESVAMVESRLLAVREEQQRLTQTVMDLRLRIERLRESSEEGSRANAFEAAHEASDVATSEASPGAELEGDEGNRISGEAPDGAADAAEMEEEEGHEGAGEGQRWV